MMNYRKSDLSTLIDWDINDLSDSDAEYGDCETNRLPAVIGAAPAESLAVEVLRVGYVDDIELDAVYAAMTVRAISDQVSTDSHSDTMAHQCDGRLGVQ